MGLWLISSSLILVACWWSMWVKPFSINIMPFRARDIYRIRQFSCNPWPPWPPFSSFPASESEELAFSELFMAGNELLPLCCSGGRWVSRYPILWKSGSSNHRLVGGFNPSEKYESQLGWWHSQYLEKQNSCSKPTASHLICGHGHQPSLKGPTCVTQAILQCHAIMRGVAAEPVSTGPISAAQKCGFEEDFGTDLDVHFIISAVFLLVVSLNVSLNGISMHLLPPDLPSYRSSRSVGWARWAAPYSAAWHLEAASQRSLGTKGTTYDLKYSTNDKNIPLIIGNIQFTSIH